MTVARCSALAFHAADVAALCRDGPAAKASGGVEDARGALRSVTVRVASCGAEAVHVAVEVLRDEGPMGSDDDSACDTACVAEAGPARRAGRPDEAAAAASPGRRRGPSPYQHSKGVGNGDDSERAERVSQDGDDGEEAPRGPWGEEAAVREAAGAERRVSQEEAWRDSEAAVSLCAAAERAAVLAEPPPCVDASHDHDAAAAPCREGAADLAHGGIAEGRREGAAAEQRAAAVPAAEAVEARAGTDGRPRRLLRRSMVLRAAGDGAFLYRGGDGPGGDVGAKVATVVDMCAARWLKPAVVTADDGARGEDAVELVQRCAAAACGGEAATVRVRLEGPGDEDKVYGPSRSIRGGLVKAIDDVTNPNLPGAAAGAAAGAAVGPAGRVKRMVVVVCDVSEGGQYMLRELLESGDASRTHRQVRCRAHGPPSACGQARTAAGRAAASGWGRRGRRDPRLWWQPGCTAERRTCKSVRRGVGGRAPTCLH